MRGDALYRRLASAAGPPVLALVACLLCYAAGWRGTDWAAQIYHAGQVSRHGLTIWDPGWYGGTYPLNYSFLFPLAGGYLGLWPVAAISASASAACFDRLTTAALGRRPAASWYFALTTLVEVAIGQLPTLGGEAFALGCVLALSGRRRVRLWAGGALGILAGLTSPVAGSLLALVLVAWGLTGVRRRQAGVSMARLGVGALALAASAALPLAFPGAGYFPFSFSEAAVVVLIAAGFAAPWLGAPEPVRAAGALYGVVTVALFAVHSQMGDNDARLAAYVGAPLALCYLPTLGKRRGTACLLAGAVGLALVVWDWSPVVEAFGGASNGASSEASYYRPLVEELERVSGGAGVKVEVPPLAHHWESAYLAPQYPLARGWERQLDMAYNPLFYGPRPLSAAAYRAWLLGNGVSYVALANAPLDYAATAEGALLRSGRVAGLSLVWRTPSWEMWKVMGSAGLAEGPARLSRLQPDGMRLTFSTGGTAVVRLRWTPFWSLPATSRATACVREASGGWTAVSSTEPGTVRIGVSLLGPDQGRCPQTSGPA